MRTLEDFLKETKEKGIPINTIYDIGAYMGQWSQNTQHIFPESTFILFEANPAYYYDLLEKGFRFINGVVLSDHGRKEVEFFNGSNTGDSYYKETSKHYENQTSITLRCYTLDDLIIEDPDFFPIPDFMKLDTQGSELDILKGSESFLDEVSFIYIELPIICYNEGSPNIQEYLEYMKVHNFIPVEVLEIHRSEDTVLQIDIMFVRNDIKQKYYEPNVYHNPLR